MTRQKPIRYQVGDLILDTGARRVLRGQESLELGTLTFDLFVALVESAPNIATYDVLAELVWSGRAVTPETIAQRASMLRRALSDSTRAPRYFRAVRGKGFRLLAEVSEENNERKVVAGANKARPSIAVLPFATLGDEPDQEYFADGLVEDVITDLSHVPQLLVISRQSTFTYKGTAIDVRDIAKRLGVSFVLQGSVRRNGNYIRVTAQLVDGVSGGNVWSKRYSQDIGDIFEMQDNLTGEIVAALDIQLVSGEQGRRRYNKIVSAAAREILYKGMFHYYKYERSAGEIARRLFEEFTQMEPDSVLGYVWLTNYWAFALVVQWENPAMALAALRDNVDKCFAIDENDPQARVGDTYYKAVCGDLDGALRSVNMAISVSPNLDDLWFAHGWVQMMLGDPHQAIRSLKRAMRLCPILNTLQLGVLGAAYRNAGQYDNAIETLNTCVRHFPEFVHAHAGLAITYGLMGDIEMAKREVKAVLAADPDYSIERFTTPNLYLDKTVMEEAAEVLRLAGMPER